jgi:putative spermidine/putrescine transport system ATP-binding protein
MPAPAAMLRPERIRLAAAGAGMGQSASGQVAEVQYFGAFTRIKVDVGVAVLQVDLADEGRAMPALGEHVGLHWNEQAVHRLAQ